MLCLSALSCGAELCRTRDRQGSWSTVEGLKQTVNSIHSLFLPSVLNLPRKMHHGSVPCPLVHLQQQTSQPLLHGLLQVQYAITLYEPSRGHVRYSLASRAVDAMPPSTNRPHIPPSFRYLELSRAKNFQPKHYWKDMTVEAVSPHESFSWWWSGRSLRSCVYADRCHAASSARRTLRPSLQYYTAKTVMSSDFETTPASVLSTSFGRMCSVGVLNSQRQSKFLLPAPECRDGAASLHSPPVNDRHHSDSKPRRRKPRCGHVFSSLHRCANRRADCLS